MYVLKAFVDKYILGSKNGSELSVCFAGMNMTFDTLWHNRLFLKIQKASICGKVYNILKSMDNGYHSTEIAYGVDQGNS